MQITDFQVTSDRILIWPGPNSYERFYHMHNAFLELCGWNFIALISSSHIVLLDHKGSLIWQNDSYPGVSCRINTRTNVWFQTSPSVLRHASFRISKFVRMIIVPHKMAQVTSSKNDYSHALRRQICLHAWIIRNLEAIEIFSFK